MAAAIVPRETLRLHRNRPRQAAEDQYMRGIESRPVQHPAYAVGLESRRTAKLCPMLRDGVTGDFQPPPARDFHLRAQAQSPIGLEFLDPPEINDVPDPQMFFITPSAQAGTADEAVQVGADLPQGIRKQPSATPADALDDSEQLSWGCVD